MATYPLLPEKEVRAQQAIKILERYWAGNEELIRKLPIRSIEVFPCTLPPQMKLVSLPNFALDCGVDGNLLVPAECAAQWDQVPWLDVVWWMANGWAERLWEVNFGCVHSYSFNLKKWDSRLWKYAWVNRIALFLRRWSAYEMNQKEFALFGSLPKAELLLTHDVDAIRKTGVIRFKQSAFNLFNCARVLLDGEFKLAIRKLVAACKFLFSGDDYMGIQHIFRMEEKSGVRSTFLFYAGKTGWRRSIKALLIDPSYDLASPKLGPLFEEMHNGGWNIGLHTSAIDWCEPANILEQCQRLEKQTKRKAVIVRQHWLRFSWEKTWSAQASAGLGLDLTLGFNDRSGFRNSAALCMSAFHAQDVESKFEIIPMVLMDSHLYDYSNLSNEGRLKSIEHYLGEVKAVGGIASIIWHPHVFGGDYDWTEGYQQLLDCWIKKSVFK